MTANQERGAKGEEEAAPERGEFVRTYVTFTKSSSSSSCTCGYRSNREKPTAALFCGGLLIGLLPPSSSPFNVPAATSWSSCTAATVAAAACVRIYRPACLPTYLSTCLLTCPLISFLICPLVHLFIYLPACLPTFFPRYSVTAKFRIDPERPHPRTLIP